MQERQEKGAPALGCMTVGALGDEPADFSAAQTRQPHDWTQGEFYQEMTEFYASPTRRRIDCQI